MKQTFLAILSIALFASCEQSPKAETEKKAEEKVYRIDMTSSERHAAVDSAAITLEQATNWIHRYTDSQLNGVDGDTSELVKENLSFMISADILRAYLSDTSIKMLDFYIGEKANKKLAIVYIGATKVDSTASGGSITYTEHAYHTENEPDIPMALDNVVPCPHCVNRNSIFSLSF